MKNIGNAYLIPKRFPFQSYFHDTALEKAILTQAQGQQIVATTVQTTEMRGRAIGLHPDSECPIAVRFRLDAAAKETSGIYILTPGMIITPNPDEDFSAVQWGLPFGWLGGGVAALQIFQGNQGYSPGRKKEVIFHQQRIRVQADAADPTYVANLPFSFPWKNAKSYTTTNTSGFTQGGEQAINVTPTRWVMRLRLNLPTTLVGPPLMRMIFKALQGLDNNVDGISWDQTTQSYQDVTWPLNAAATNAAYPVIEITNPAARFGGPDASLALLDLSGGDLTNAYIDLVRYGEI